MNKNDKKLKLEHSEVKVRLAELVDFINSEEYYKLNDREKVVLSMQRSGMETYIKALSIRLWGNEEVPSYSMLMGSLLASMMVPTMPTGIATPSVTDEKPTTDKK